MRYELIIFDWDGTLMDSVPKIVSCMQAAAADAEWGELEVSAIEDIIGLGLPEAIAKLCPGIEPEQAERLRQRYSELVRRYHPDRNGGDRTYEARLGRVVEAYQVLRKSAAIG